jgi:hypothetical protein
MWQVYSHSIFVDGAWASFPQMDGAAYLSPELPQ